MCKGLLSDQFHVELVNWNFLGDSITSIKMLRKSARHSKFRHRTTEACTRNNERAQEFYSSDLSPQTTIGIRNET